MEYRQEHFDHGESVINGSELLDRTDSYEAWLKSVSDNANRETVSPGRVVTDTFFAINETGRLVGIIALRHELNDFLRDFAHCGYSVRPSERRRGYAAEMLRQVLVLAKKAGLTEVRLSAERNNDPSVKTIIKNGGVYEGSFSYEGRQADRYRIQL